MEGNRKGGGAGRTLDPDPDLVSPPGRDRLGPWHERREEAELLRARNELARAVYQHYLDARTTAELIDVFNKGLLKQAQEALRLAQFSFQQGASSLLEVFDAQRVQRQIQMDYVQARYELSVSLARLERAVGGTLSANRLGSTDREWRGRQECEDRDEVVQSRLSVCSSAWQRQ